MPLASSSAQQALQALGARLREVRLEAGLTGRTLAARARWHPSKISKIEAGRQTASTEDIRVWCGHCNATDKINELVATLLAVQGMFVEWRRLERTGLRVSNEAEAREWQQTNRFRIYSSTVIPGPVQTRAYLTSVLQSLLVQRGFRDDIAETVEVRLTKQEVIHHPRNTFAKLIEESVVRSPVGGAETMAGQLGHLLEACTLPTISLGIIPLGVDRTTIWPAEAFWMFDNRRVTVELISGYVTITQPHEITLYGEAFNRLADLAALR